MMLTLAMMTILFYLGVATIQYLQLIGKVRYNTPRFFTLGLPTLMLHAFLLYKWIDIGVGQNLSFFNMFSFAIWLIAAFIMLISIFQPLRNLSIFVFPLAALSILLALVFPTVVIVKTATHPKALIHILSATVAFSILCLAGFQGLLLSVQERMLRHQYAGGVTARLPPLETMENLLFHLLWLGFILLTIVLVSSFYFFYGLSGSASLQQKMILAIAAWIIYSILLGGRYFFGWRGRKVTYYTFSGAIVLIVIYFFSNSFT